MFAFVAKHRGIWPLKTICETLGVSRSGFYSWLSRAEGVPDAGRSRLQRHAWGWRRAHLDVLPPSGSTEAFRALCVNDLKAYRGEWVGTPRPFEGRHRGLVSDTA